MRLALIHRRLSVLMSMASLLAFAGGAGVEPVAATLAGTGLVLALFWQPSSSLSQRMEKVWLPLAALLVLRAVFVLVVRGDVVIPVVDLLFLLLIAEALRPLEATNDSRLYSLSFALLLASTAYRPGLLFAAAFTAYVGLATLALMVGHLRRMGERHGTGEIPIPRAFLLTTAALSAVTLVFSAAVFLTFPRVSRGWAGRGEPLAAAVAGFADEVTLGSHGSRIFGNPQIVLRVEFPEGIPSDYRSLHWRGRSYDHFDGIRWSRSSGIPPSLAPSAWYAAWGRDLLEQRIYSAPLDARVLFGLHPMTDIDAQPGIQPIIDNVGDVLYWGSAAPVYTVQSIRERPSPEDLRSAGGGFTPARQYFLQTPPLSEGVRTLADSLLGGMPAPYDKAQALVDWFHGEFAYTRELPASAGEATLDYFLLQRRAGHCEYFSTAMALLLRSQGVPAREVNGFLGGEWSQFGDYLAVTQNQAHAWVEVWFPGFGWVPFDPTPPGTGEGFADRAWFWPGRFLFDALQHRWNKWILDYSLQTQFGLLQRAQRLFSPETAQDSAPDDRGPGGYPGNTLWWLAGIALLVAAGFRPLRQAARVPPSTRLFLELREVSRRAGVPGEALHSPLALTRHLESIRHPAALAARRVVNGYLRDRYSGHPLEENALSTMRRAMREARSALLKRRFR
ncbi:MAG: transglutaminase family protein [Longimicrobiales bacterium]